jgi:D-alanine--poly(phosphoribitol) ligase subunit 1
MFFQKIFSNFNKLTEKAAFFMGDRYYSYWETRNRVFDYAQAITKLPAASDNIGIVTGDDFDTYCALLAALYLQRPYVPVNRKNPVRRIADIVGEAGVDLIFCSDAHVASELTALDLPTVKILRPGMVPSETIQGDAFVLKEYDPEQLAYILFTSGSTGKPKGVPINYGNMGSYLTKMVTDPLFQYSQTDRFIQMFELSFDPSVFSIMVPLYVGATCYVVPDSGVVFHHIFNMLEDHKITVALFIPSVINFLKPYFKEIDLPDLRYSMFCGDALHDSVAKGWQLCCPNAAIHNWYGPTETTVICTVYPVLPNADNSVNDIISIGKPLENVTAILIDDDDKLITDLNIKGELCFNGDQVINNYWHNEAADAKSFMLHPETQQTFYKTGDICFLDDQGNYHFSNRKDFQVKINGYRLELAEVEHYARKDVNVNQAVVVKKNDQEMVLFVETKDSAFNEEELTSSLKSFLPWYMIPGKIVALKQMPYNQNMKIDRAALLALTL